MAKHLVMGGRPGDGLFAHAKPARAPVEAVSAAPQKSVAAAQLESQTSGKMAALLEKKVTKLQACLDQRDQEQLKLKEQLRKAELVAEQADLELQQSRVELQALKRKQETLAEDRDEQQKGLQQARALEEQYARAKQDLSLKAHNADAALQQVKRDAAKREQKDRRHIAELEQALRQKDAEMTAHEEEWSGEIKKLLLEVRDVSSAKQQLGAELRKVVEERNDLLGEAQTIAKRWEVASQQSLDTKEVSLDQKEKLQKLQSKVLQWQKKCEDAEADRKRTLDTLGRREKELQELKQQVEKLEQAEKRSAQRAREEARVASTKVSRVDSVEAKLKDVLNTLQKREAQLSKLQKLRERDRTDAECWRTAGQAIGQVRQTSTTAAPRGDLSHRSAAPAAQTLSPVRASPGPARAASPAKPSSGRAVSPSSSSGDDGPPLLGDLELPPAPEELEAFDAPYDPPVMPGLQKQPYDPPIMPGLQKQPFEPPIMPGLQPGQLQKPGQVKDRFSSLFE